MRTRALKAFRRGRIGSGGGASVPVVAEPDTTDPVAGTLAASVVSSTQINVSLSGQSDNVGITNITLAWSPNGTDTWTTLDADWDGSTYNHTSLSASTQYFYRAIVSDAATNQATATANATTDAAGGTVTHYVAPYASVSGATSDTDTVNGTAYASATTIGNPCTMGEALANCAPGDIIDVAPGIITGAVTGERYIPSFNPATSGTSGNPIIFKARNAACYGILGATELQSGSAVEGAGCPTYGAYLRDYIIWDGFYVNEANSAQQGDTGLAALWDTTGSVVKNGKHIGAHTAYGTNKNSVRFERATSSRVTNMHLSGNTDTQGGENQAAVMVYSSTDIEIDHLLIDTSNAGIFIKGESIGDLVNPFSVHHNRVEGGFAGITLGGVKEAGGIEAGSYCDVYQNLIFGQSFSSFWLIPYDTLSPDSVRFVNNTIYAPAAGSEGAIYISGNNPAVMDAVFNDTFMQNNIIWSSGSRIMNWGVTPTHIANLTSDRNCFWNFNTDRFCWMNDRTFAGDNGYFTLADWQAAGLDTNAINVNPLFADAVNDDFTLQGTSGALGTGVDILNLLGGGTTAPINMGCYIEAGQTDSIGLLPE